MDREREYLEKQIRDPYSCVTEARLAKWKLPAPTYF